MKTLLALKRLIVMKRSIAMKTLLALKRLIVMKMSTAMKTLLGEKGVRLRTFDGRKFFTRHPAKALEKLTGANVGQLLPIPDVSNKKFPEAMKHEAKGLHLIMWSFHTGDYPRVGAFCSLIYLLGVVAIWWAPDAEDNQLRD